jgi:hypothetical protein
MNLKIRMDSPMSRKTKDKIPPDRLCINITTIF